MLANLGALGAAQVSTWALTLVWTIFVPRQLGPAGTGLLVLMWSVNGLLLTICGLGSRTMLVREIARAPEQGPQLLATAMVVRAAAAIPCGALVLAYVIVGRFHAPEDLVLFLTAAMTVLMLLAEPLQAAFQALERMRYLAYSQIVNKGIASIVGVALVFLGFRAVTLVYLTLAATAVVLVLNWMWLRRAMVLDWARSLRGIYRFLRGSLSYWAYTLFHTIYIWADSAMIGLLAPTEVLGLYGVPTKLSGVLMFIPVTFATAWLPRLSATYSQGTEQLKKASRAPLELALTLSLPVCVGAALVAGPLLVALYGPDFARATPVLVILAVATIPTYLNIIVATILIAAGRQTAWTVVLLGAGVFNIAINAVLIRYYQDQFHNGAIGAALALLITEMVMAPVGLIIGRQYLDWQLLLPRLFRCLLATLGMAVAVSLVSRFGLLAQVGTGALVFALLGLLLGVTTKEEREVGRAFAARAVRQVLRA
jgi:polysaccharide transporter, PST family